MAHKVLKSPNFLDQCIYWKVIGGRKVWRDINNKRLYTWDEFHGELEVFNLRGRHLGSASAITGEIIKEPVKGRRLDV